MAPPKSSRTSCDSDNSSLKSQQSIDQSVAASERNEVDSEKNATLQSSAVKAESLECGLSDLDQDSLPPPDHGKEAYLFLIACFVLEGVIWGLIFSYGVFEAYYNSHAPFEGHNSGIAAIGTISTGFCYFATPIVAIFYQRWPQTRRVGMLIGLTCVVVSLVAASFCNSVSGLLATQGVLYAVGTIVMYFPVIIFVDEWFVARKGLAYGIMWAGAGVAGAIIPFLMQWLLDQYGHATALRVWAVSVTILLTPCLYFLKPRLPSTARHTSFLQDYAFVKHASFWVCEIGNILQSLGYFLPQLWIPSFARSLGLPQYAGPLSVALINVAAAFGSIIIGRLCDRYHVSVPVFLCSVGASTAALLFWGLTTSAPMLYIFAILWGLSGGSYIATWSGQAVAICSMEKKGNVNAGMVLGLLSAGKGVGGVISGPVSSSLVHMERMTHAHFAYGSTYGYLIIFTGVSAILGALPCIGRALKLI